jgi:hypothetical protein
MMWLRLEFDSCCSAGVGYICNNAITGRFWIGSATSDFKRCTCITELVREAQFDSRFILTYLRQNSANYKINAVLSQKFIGTLRWCEIGADHLSSCWP